MFWLTENLSAGALRERRLRSRCASPYRHPEVVFPKADWSKYPPIKPVALVCEPLKAAWPLQMPGYFFTFESWRLGSGLQVAKTRSHQAFIEKFPDELPYLSNFCCLPARAGGSSNGLDGQTRSQTIGPAWVDPEGVTRLPSRSGWFLWLVG